MWRSLAAGVVLAIPVALTLGSTVHEDVDAIREHSRLTAVQANVVPPYDYGASENVPLLLGIRRHVPEDERVSFVPRGGPRAAALHRDGLDPLGRVRDRAAARRRGRRLALGRHRRPHAAERRNPAAARLAVRPRLARRAVIRGLVGIGLALLALLPLGAGVLFLTRSPFRLGLGMFTGLAAAMVLLPPLHYVGARAVAPARARPRRPGARARRGVTGVKPRVRERIEPLPLVVLAVPLLLLAARGAEKPVDTYDAFANWTLKAKLLYAGRSFSDATIAPPVHREYPLGLPSVEAFVLHAIGSANTRVLHVLFAVFLAGLTLVAWHVLRPHVSAWPLVAGLSLLLWMPAARDQALTGLADLPLACLFVSAVLLFGGGELALGSVFAAAALATKRDALAFVTVLYAVSFAAVLVRRERDRLVPLAISAFWSDLGCALADLRRDARSARQRRVGVAGALRRARLRRAPDRTRGRRSRRISGRSRSRSRPSS